MTLLENFKSYAAELDKKHDKFERIVKLSRDITIASKRIVFLLHSIGRNTKKSSVLHEAESKLKGLISHNWKLVANELQNEDPYLFQRAFSPGMQEFIEACSFYNYLKNGEFPGMAVYQENLKYRIEGKEKKSLTEVKKSEIITTIVPSDFILGLADVTGELMRKCINSLGEGDTESCFNTCNIVRNFYTGFLGINPLGQREISRKIVTLKQSLLKMEAVCYNIHVRGSEIPRHMLADSDGAKANPEEDEGVFEQI